MGSRLLLSPRIHQGGSWDCQDRFHVLFPPRVCPLICAVSDLGPILPMKPETFRIWCLGLTGAPGARACASVVPALVLGRLHPSSPTFPSFPDSPASCPTHIMSQRGVGKGSEYQLKGIILKKQGTHSNPPTNEQQPSPIKWVNTIPLPPEVRKGERVPSRVRKAW